MLLVCFTRLWLRVGWLGVCWLFGCLLFVDFAFRGFYFHDWNMIFSVLGFVFFGV